MIGILLVAHGNLGESLIACATHVLGQRPEKLESLDVSFTEAPETVYQRGQGLLAQLDEGDGVLVLSDMYGATPCNITCRLLQPGRIEGISGVSLPMLVKALNYRAAPLEEVIAKAVQGGHDGVFHFTLEACNVASKH